MISIIEWENFEAQKKTILLVLIDRNSKGSLQTSSSTVRGNNIAAMPVRFS